MIRCLIAPLDWVTLHRLLQRAFLIFTHFLLREVVPRVLWILFDLLGLASWRFKGFIDHCLGWARFLDFVGLLDRAWTGVFLSFMAFAVPYYYSRTCWNSFRSMYLQHYPYPSHLLAGVRYVYNVQVKIVNNEIASGGWRRE